MESQEQQKQLKISKIVIHRNICIGAASCVAVSPGVFELDTENKAVMLKNDGTADSGPVEYGVLREAGADPEMILLAAKSCPTQAIHVFDEDGKLIFPA